MIKIFVLLTALSLEVFAAESKLALNDVTVLLPLPAIGEWNYLPQPETTTPRGTLLAREVFNQIPQLLAFATNDDIYSAMRAVGVRIDPCFTEGHGPLKCQNQIRLVWQPLSDADTETSTFDASMHSFYQLTESEFKLLVSDLKKLKTDFGTDANDLEPLGINPIIKSQGLNSEYYRNFLKIIYSYIGETNFSRVTFMQLSMTGNVWVFGGFDYKNAELKPISIPRVDSFRQTFRNAAVPRPIWFLGGITPEPTQDENFNILTRDSRKLAPTDEAAVIEAAKSALKIENPKFHNPGTVDCVSCHVAQPAKIWAMRQYPWLQLDRLNRDVTYQSKLDIRNLSPMQVHTNILRAFGYFMDMPFIAQRTINESAEVVNYISLNY